MTGEGALMSFSVASLVEDVLQQHGNRLRDLDLESRKAEEAASRRYEAAGWLRKMVGVVAAKDLPAEPSEEEFRLGLRSGIILCNSLNKVQPGAVPKVVESPCDAALIPDGAALSAFQYFENVRNFLVAAQEIGFPTFEASDLEQGGKSARVVNSVLALKSYSEWKQTGGNGVWKFGGNVKPTISTKSFVRKNAEPFMNSSSRNSTMNEKSLNALSTELDSNKMSTFGSLSTLVRAVLLDKKPEEVPLLVESVLSKVVEEFEHRIASQCELIKTTPKDVAVSQGNKFVFKSASDDKKIEDRHIRMIKKVECLPEEELKIQNLKQLMIFDHQQRDIQELKHALRTTKAGMQFIQMKFHEEFNNLGMHIKGLAHAASGYRKVLEENRKLYNQVQDLKGSIRVYCRVRPFLSGKSNYLSTVDHIEDGNISINTPSKLGKGRKSFGFNKVFGPSATQAEVFSDMQPLIRSVLDGYNVCIFAYGQTGSGKTYTMTGPKDLTEGKLGVNYRALSDLFLLAEQMKDIFCYNVAVQMIEIYNEQVRDLLVTDGSNKRLEIRNSSQTGLNVPDANLVPVSSTSDVIDLMNLGQRNRAVGATALNDRSSRSHSCLTVHVQGRDLTSGTILRGCMHLVDLAGSERVDKSEVTGDRLKEAQHINKSLSALGDVIASLAQKNPHVPYRNSKLTQLLQDSLGGQAKTLMFVHISPEPDAVGETISTLKFAERVATVELGAARVNKDGADVKDLKEQIASLKAALARKDGEAEHFLHSVSGNSEGYRRKENELSPFNSNQRLGDVNDSNSFPQPMGDVGNMEVHTNSTSGQKRQSFDLDELLANSPPWPPVISPNKNYGEDEKEMGSGEWVDKVMVNKQDAVNRVQNPQGCWEADNGHLPDLFYQKYLSHSSKIYPEQSYNMLMGNNRFNSSSTEDMDDLDAATSDSSEPDLLWQFNQTKLSGMANGIESKTKKPISKAAKDPDLRNLNPMLGPSPSRKLTNGVGAPLQRRPAPVDMKRRTGSRK
ncbi:kinesin-like protein KIN-14I isoform X2 [Hevea brasiliensis]|uniref:kinesin-like protein KIN-14I isoform X2 n=1 Tax=Hevea brasiliensis TaxID=3981 RepID=UPI0025CE5207|nr:kinesin-like protein KIN-14I isoform X2 [Hevea brasiliensis]